MSHRYPRLATLALAALLAGCAEDAPTGTHTVSMRLVDGAAHGGRPFATHMTEEVTSSPLYNGDPDGTGTALITINFGQREVCWELTAAGISATTAAHIHEAPAGVRGPVVVGLTPPDASGRSAGCTSGVDRELLERILLDTERFYVNVHTTEKPQGAIRGQLGG